MNRTQLLKSLGVSIIALLLIMPFFQGNVGAAVEAITWGAPQQRSAAPDGIGAFQADVKYDNNGFIHISWVEFHPVNTSIPTRLLYTNNIAGTWLPPYEVSGSVGRGSEPLQAMTIVGNQVHFIYISGSLLASHRYLTLSGANPTKSAVTTLSTTKASNPEAITDLSGNVHAFWGDRRVSPDYAQYIHRIWSNGSWDSTGGRIVRMTGVNQKLGSATATADGKIHLAFTDPSYNIRYNIFNGSTWSPSADIANGDGKQVALASAGNTVLVLYARQPSGMNHTMFYRQGGNGVWSAGVQLSSGTSYDEFPSIAYSNQLGRAYAVWASGASTTTTRTVAREIQVGVSFGTVQVLGGDRVEYPKVDARQTVSAVWQDKQGGTGVSKVWHSIGNAGGVIITPTPTNTPTPLPGADFTPVLTSASPTTNPNLTINLQNLSGGANEYRYSLTPFGASDPAPGWMPIPADGNISVTVPSNFQTCLVTVYLQVRNSSTGGASTVKTVTATVDNGVQATILIGAVNYNVKPAAPNTEMPFAPDIQDPNYFRDLMVRVSVGQEPAGCAGMDKYQIRNELIDPADTAFPDLNRTVAVVLDNMNDDLTGRGQVEQDVVFTSILTDTLGNYITTGKMMTYDDDPPILANGGSASFPNGSTTSVSVVPVEFTADVTDDGYKGGVPTKQYWGVWVLATTSTTVPTPQEFLQYGDVIQLPAGSTTIPYVRLVNGLTGTAPGARYVHIRFLDGAANYSENVLTTPAITLSSGYTGLRTFAPLVLK